MNFAELSRSKHPRRRTTLSIPATRPRFASVAEEWPHRVIDGRYFVLGDNRDASEDSRHWGDVDGNAVVARAWLRYAPPSRWRSAPF